jgi:hypothetical protein
MRIGWMPYLEIAYPLRRPKVLEVGKARFLPDSDEVWANEIKRPRPNHLQIFRDFPPVTSDEQGDSIRGTVVLCDDETWLRNFLDEAVSVVYFLGDTPMPGQPTERFAYHPLRLTTDGENPAELVSFSTKHGDKWEDETSLVLYPPLVVRGYLGEYRLNLDRPEHQKLLETIKDDPHNRLIVAARQYFRTQFSDVFTSTLQEDFATHCSVIEAGLNIDTRHAAGDRFVDALTAIYGKDGGLEEFFLGLYVARSLYVHGAPQQAALSGQTREEKAYQFFVSRRAKFSALRVLSRDVLLRALGRPENPFGFEPADSAKPILRKVLHSDNLLRDACKLLIKAKAADLIMGMSGPQFDAEVGDLAGAMKSDFDWQCVTHPVDLNHLYRGICTCALISARVTNSKGPVYLATDEVGRAADAKDAQAIGRWSLNRRDWSELWVNRDNRMSAIQLMLAILARKFE